MSRKLSRNIVKSIRFIDLYITKYLDHLDMSRKLSRKIAQYNLFSIKDFVWQGYPEGGIALISMETEELSEVAP